MNTVRSAEPLKRRDDLRGEPRMIAHNITYDYTTNTLPPRCFQSTRNIPPWKRLADASGHDPKAQSQPQPKAQSMCHLAEALHFAAFTLLQPRPKAHSEPQNQTRCVSTFSSKAEDRTPPWSPLVSRPQLVATTRANAMSARHKDLSPGVESIHHSLGRVSHVMSISHVVGVP